MSWELLNQCFRDYAEREKKKAESAATAIAENAIDELPVENQAVDQVRPTSESIYRRGEVDIRSIREDQP